MKRTPALMVALTLALAGCEHKGSNKSADAGPDSGSDAAADLYWPPVPDWSPNADLGALKKIGEPCSGDQECADKICLKIPTGMTCTMPCNGPSSCPSGYFCKYQPGPWGNNLCYPGTPPPPCVKPDAGPPTDAGAADSGPDGGGPGGLTRTAIGSPKWEVTDLQFFAAPCGTQTSNYVEGLNSAKKVLGQHIFYTPSCYGFGPDPSKCHAPQGELAAGATAAGFPLSGFTTSDLTAPNGIHFMLTMKAKDDWGASPCSSCEPVIPDTLFWINFDGDLYRDGTLVDGDFDNAFCSLSQLAPMFAGKSFDHFHLSFMENSDYISPLPGTYELKFKLTDVMGQGWNVSKTFVVTGTGADAGVTDGPIAD